MSGGKRRCVLHFNGSFVKGIMDQFDVGSIVWASARGDIFWPGKVKLRLFTSYISFHVDSTGVYISNTCIFV